MFKLAQGICVFALVETTGMVGVAEGQYAHFNVLNSGVLPPATGVVCSALLTFLGGDGGVLKTKLVSVAPGDTGYIDLFSDLDLSLAIDARKEIRATYATPPVVPVASSATPTTACTLIATLEVIDEITQRTQAVLGGIHSVPAVVPAN
jgi:hypothetical protein